MKNVTEKIKLTVINLLIAALLVAGIGFGILQWLDNYTDHGISILVPDFSGFTPEEAREVARHERLDIQVIDSIYDKDAAPGSVVEQYPAGGEHVKEGRTIRLTINARTGSYEGMSASRAYTINLLACETAPASVTFAGCDEGTYTYDATGKKLVISVPTTACDTQVTVTINR